MSPEDGDSANVGGPVVGMLVAVIALVILYVFPQIGLWLPSVFYGR